MSLREKLERRLEELPGLVRRPVRRGTGSIYLPGDQEIAHFHGDERMDVRLTRQRIPMLKLQGAFDERVRTRGPAADWVAVRVVEEGDISLALRLVEQALRAE